MRNTRRLSGAAAALVVLTGACTAGPTHPPSPHSSQAPSSVVPSPTSTSDSTLRLVVPFPMALEERPWTRAISRLVGERNVSVTVGVGDHFVYVRDGSLQRLPASNEKLLTSMTALSEFGARYRFPTVAEGSASGGVVAGDLWIVGSGDPELTDASMTALAAALRAKGIRQITGSVVGDTSAFSRGWWAPGWLKGVSRAFVTRPTALALDGNDVIGLPERAAASSLSRALRRVGVQVAGVPEAGAAPAGLPTLARIRSAPLREILERQNHDSVNFDAEMITKALGARIAGPPGSTASGAKAIDDWALNEGVLASVYDGSGLSHLDRVSTEGLVTLLLKAERRPWGNALWTSLPGPDEGTLAGRLAGLPVHAKTGTLFVTPVSALSGYVRSADGRRTAFSILSRGLDEGTAVGIEDAIVGILARARIG